jgi:hypothetical protein
MYAIILWFFQFDIYVSMYIYKSFYSYISFVLSHFVLHQVILLYLIAFVTRHFSHVMSVTFIVTHTFFKHATHLYFTFSH